ncbi:MAG TPA: cytochrome c-type biogenesis protein CcmH [Terriglobia bacterium]|nr:cytochrome c-type biogenesis protein CcmH [Terriglobia bacterium]
MRCRLEIFPILAALCVSSMSFGAVAAKPTLESIGNKVYCLCGCVTTLNRCPHLPSECASRAEMEALIRKDIRAGKTEKAILNDFTAAYGVRVLASPPAHGFDLAVWILPGIGLMMGLILVIVIVKRWRRRSPPAELQDEAGIDPKLRAAVEEEMKRLTL